MNSPIRGNRFMLLFMIYTLFAPFLLGIILGLSFSIPRDQYIAVALAIGHIILFLIPFIAYQLKTKQKIKDILPMKALSLKNIILIIILSILVQVFSGLIGSVTSLIANNDVGNSVTDYLTQYPFSLLVWSVAILPGILEEVIFRGVILTNYKPAGTFKAIIFSSLLFGIMHLDLYQFFYTATLGIFLGCLVHYTKSIYASILSHFTINFSQLLLAKLVTSLYTLDEIAVEATLADKLDSIQASLTLFAYVLPFFLVFYIAFVIYNKKHNANEQDIATSYEPYFLYRPRRYKAYKKYTSYSNHISLYELLFKYPDESMVREVTIPATPEDTQGLDLSKPKTKIITPSFIAVVVLYFLIITISLRLS